MKRFLLTMALAPAAMLAFPALQEPGASPASVDSIALIIDQCPNALEHNIVFEGTKLFLTGNEEDLLVTLSVAHPSLQMRLLMQPMTFYIDPSGKKKRRFALNLPSAIEVKETMEKLNPDAVPGSIRQEGVRPDIAPLLAVLNERGATFKNNRRSTHFGYQRFFIELDRENELIKYYIRFPMAELMQDPKLSNRWSFGLVSDSMSAEMAPPGGDSGAPGMMGGPGAPEGPENMRPVGDGDPEALQELMRGNIR